MTYTKCSICGNPKTALDNFQTFQYNDTKKLGIACPECGVPNNAHKV